MSEDEQNLEERIADLEEKINYVILQINNLQHKVSDSNPELKQMMNLLQILTSTLQISKAPFTILNQTFSLNERIHQRFPELKYDTISKVIVDILGKKGNLNISQLTEQVRKERGSASRRIVRERVDILIDSGIIREVDHGYGRQIELIEPEEEGEE